LIVVNAPNDSTEPVPIWIYIVIGVIALLCLLLLGVALFLVGKRRGASTAAAEFHSATSFTVSNVPASSSSPREFRTPAHSAPSVDDTYRTIPFLSDAHYSSFRDVAPVDTEYSVMPSVD
jgi:hypothetical protein